MCLDIGPSQNCPLLRLLQVEQRVFVSFIYLCQIRHHDVDGALHDDVAGRELANNDRPLQLPSPVDHALHLYLLQNQDVEGEAVTTNTDNRNKSPSITGRGSRQKS